MTVQEMIDRLERIKDKNMELVVMKTGWHDQAHPIRGLRPRSRFDDTYVVAIEEDHRKTIDLNLQF